MCLFDNNARKLFQMPNFLSSSPDLMVVDDVVCDKQRHGAAAKTQALERVLKNFAALASVQEKQQQLNHHQAACNSAGSSSPGPVGGGGGIAPPTPTPNVWQTKGPPAAASAASASTTAPDPLLQLPNRVESLFNGGGHHSGQQSHQTFKILSI